MFTGIITNLGKLTEITPNKLKISAEKQLMQRITIGTSVSINGICLTVTNFDSDSFEIDYMPETKNKTTIKYAKKGSLVNLELSATPESLLAGHIVQGHVDGLAKLESIKSEENSRLLILNADKELTKYMVNKGSVALNGISLTIIEVKENTFSVGIIPHTWNNTMLKNISEGDYMNLEVDVLAKYVYKYSNLKIHSK